MELRHPYEWLTIPGQRKIFVLLSCLAILLMASLQIIGRPLVTDVAPAGIVSFELAGDLFSAQRMMASWGETGKVYAGLSLGVDYLFMVTYALAIGMGCVLIARNLWSRFRYASVVGVLLGWALIGAGLLDGLENYALIRILLGSQNEIWPVVAKFCAVPKFLIVAIGLVYLGAGGIAALRTRFSKG